MFVGGGYILCNGLFVLSYLAFVGIFACVTRDIPARNIYWLVSIVFIFGLSVACQFSLLVLYVRVQCPITLTLGTTAMQKGAFKLILKANEAFIYNPRHHSGALVLDDVAQGDQKMFMSIATAILLAALESFRFAALIFEVMLDPNPSTFQKSLFFTLVMEVSSRLTLTSWWTELLTEGRTSWMVTQFRSFMRPNAMIVYLNDLKGIVGFCRFPAVAILWAARSASIGHADKSDAMQIILVATTLVYLEETMEDVFVYLGTRFRDSLPRFLAPQWSTHPFYAELAKSHENFHPAQIIDNPSLTYRPLPLLPTLTFVHQAIGTQLVALLILVGLQWALGCASHPDHKDLSLVWWSLDYQCNNKQRMGNDVA